MRLRYKMTGAIAAALLTGGQALASMITIDFEGLTVGNPPQLTDFAIGGTQVAVSAFDDPNGALQQAWLYDTNNDTSDPDLNSNFCQVGVAFANCENMGKALIIQEPGNGNSPDDNANGGKLVLAFGRDVGVHMVDVLDVRFGALEVQLFDAANVLIATLLNLQNSDTGNDPTNNLFERLTLGDIQGVRRIEFNLQDSGAIDNLQISLVPAPASLWLLGAGLLGFASFRRRCV